MTVPPRSLNPLLWRTKGKTRRNRSRQKGKERRTRRQKNRTGEEKQEKSPIPRIKGRSLLFPGKHPPSASSVRNLTASPSDPPEKMTYARGPATSSHSQDRSPTNGRQGQNQHSQKPLERKANRERMISQVSASTHLDGHTRLLGTHNLRLTRSCGGQRRTAAPGIEKISAKPLITEPPGNLRHRHGVVCKGERKGAQRVLCERGHWWDSRRLTVKTEEGCKV